MRIVALLVFTAAICFFSLSFSFAQVSLLWESPTTLGDKGALYAPDGN
jgi:hypothetical protein